MLSYTGDQFVQVAIAILVCGGRGVRAGTASCHQSPRVRRGQSGLYAVQGLGILAGGAAAQANRGPLAVGLAGLVGVTAATMLAMSWTHLRGRLIQAQRGEAEALGD